MFCFSVQTQYIYILYISEAFIKVHCTNGTQTLPNINNPHPRPTQTSSTSYVDDVHTHVFFEGVNLRAVLRAYVKCSVTFLVKRATEI